MQPVLGRPWAYYVHPTSSIVENAGVSCACEHYRSPLTLPKDMRRSSSIISESANEVTLCDVYAAR
jgi:hypothetical protein